jgi:hypothetical protein
VSSAKFKEEARRVIYPLLEPGEHLKFVDLAWSEQLLDAATHDRSRRSSQEWKGALGVTYNRVIWSNPYGLSVDFEFDDIEWVREAKVSRPGSKWLALRIRLSPTRSETARFMMKNASVDEALRLIDHRRRELVVERRRAAERVAQSAEVRATDSGPGGGGLDRPEVEEEVVFHPDMDEPRRAALQRSLDIMKVQHRWDGPRLLVPKSHEEGALRALEYVRAAQVAPLGAKDPSPAETPVADGGIAPRADDDAVQPEENDQRDLESRGVGDSPSRRIEERLTALKALHEKGLISDQDLASRRAEILREL